MPAFAQRLLPFAGPVPRYYIGAMSESPSLTGPEIIRDFVTRLPGKPGVYRMYDAKGDAIYVGKARNLKARVTNYTRTGGYDDIRDRVTIEVPDGYFSRIHHRRFELRLQRSVSLAEEDPKRFGSSGRTR